MEKEAWKRGWYWGGSWRLGCRGGGGVYQAYSVRFHGDRLPVRAPQKQSSVRSVGFCFGSRALLNMTGAFLGSEIAREREKKTVSGKFQ